MPKSDPVHMLVREVLGFSAGKKRPDLDTGRMLSLSPVRLPEIIREAAASMSPEFRERPSRGMSSQERVTDNGHYDIDPDRKTVEGDIPPLVTGLEKVIASGENL